MTKAHYILVSCCVLVGALASRAVPVVAAESPASCPNEQLRSEQPYGLRLPDCRAYELVSPLEKNDNNVITASSRASVSDESPAIAYASQGSFAEPRAAGVGNRYIAHRESDGWSTQNISPPYTSFGSEALAVPFRELYFTPNLSKGLVDSTFTPLVEGEPAGYVNLYVANIDGGTYQTVTTVDPPEVHPYEANLTGAELYSAGVSSDLSHVVFQEDASLCCGASKQGRTSGEEHDHVYEWVDGELFQVDVPPTGVKLEHADEVGAGGNLNEPSSGDVWHAVSENGLRVFFTGPEGPGDVVARAKQLYVRENPEQSPVGGSECSAPGDACTIEVSASQRTRVNAKGEAEPDPDPNGPQSAYFQDASADGSRVFFFSTAELTNDANTGPADNAPNLYEYDVETGVLSDLTVDTEDEDGAAVLGTVTAGDSGSYVYFVAEGRLTSRANAGGEESEAGKPNLYLYHAGTVTFILTLVPNKVKDTDTFDSGDEADWLDSLQGGAVYGPGRHTVRVTGDGSRLAFESTRSLPGYDNEQAGPGECEGPSVETDEEGGRCREVYLYDAETERLVCVSCDPGKARPVGPAELGGHEQTSGSFAAEPSPFYVPHNLSEDGGRLFFQSPDALVPQDSNGLRDVYEWEALGEGSCKQVGGCVYPISDVAGGYESLFMDATPDGENVFIATKDQLVPAADTDSRVNLYDVRVGGGFPVVTAPPACDNADSCKPSVSSQPAVFGAPGSATFSGPGNPAPVLSAPAVVKQKTKPTRPVRCKKPRKLIRGKCVNRSKKKGKAVKAGYKRGASA